MAEILCHCDGQIAKTAHSVFLEQLQLPEEFAIIADLGLVRREMAVPEQSHFFLERSRAGQHAVGPPVRHAVGFENAGTEPVEEFIDHGLEAAVAGRLDLDSKRLALLLGEVGNGWTSGRERLQSRIVNSGMLEGKQLPGSDALEKRTRRAIACAGVNFASAWISSGVPPNPARSNKCAAKS